jgi:hypothetical protein
MAHSDEIEPELRDRDIHDERNDYGELDRPKRSPEKLTRCVGPATNLMAYSTICGLLAVFAISIGSGICILANNPNQNKQFEDGLYIVIVSGIVIAVCIPIAIGALKMYRLQSLVWSYTSAFLAIVSLFCVPCFGLIGLGLGIWALVALNDSEVKRQFRQHP